MAVRHMYNNNLHFASVVIVVMRQWLQLRAIDLFEYLLGTLDPTLNVNHLFCHKWDVIWTRSGVRNIDSSLIHACVCSCCLHTIAVRDENWLGPKAKFTIITFTMIKWKQKWITLYILMSCQFVGLIQKRQQSMFWSRDDLVFFCFHLASSHSI